MTTNSPSLSINPPKSGPVLDVKPPTPKNPTSPQNSQNTKTRDMYFRYFVAATSLALMIVVGYFILTGPFATAIRATVAPVPNESASLLFAYPLTIKADGIDKSTIDVLVADREGRPIPNKAVTVVTTMGALVPSNAPTDTSGHARFELTVEEPGIAEISLRVDSVAFAKRITVKGE